MITNHILSWALRYTEEDRGRGSRWEKMEKENEWGKRRKERKGEKRKKEKREKWEKKKRQRLMKTDHL